MDISQTPIIIEENSMLTDIKIFLLIICQIFLCARGFIRIRKYVFDMCGYIEILFFIFFEMPALDLYFGTNLFIHRIYDYGVYAEQETIIKYIIIMTAIMFLFDIGYQIGSGRISTLSDNKRLVDIEDNVLYFTNTYIFITSILIFFWLYIMYIAYREFGQSLFLFLLPSRKRGEFSGALSLLQWVIPDIIFSLSIIRNWGKNKVLGPSLFPLLMVLLTVSSSNQRREMIQGIVFCGLLLLIKYFKLLKDRNGIEEFFRRKPWKRYAAIGVAVTVILIPLLWYVRNLSNQILRGGITVNPFSMHSFFDLIFGSSSTGFDTTLIIDQFDQTRGGLFGHCILFFFSFWIPRAVYPEKPLQITQMIKVARGDWGNLSTFMVNDLYFSFKGLSVIFVPLCGMLISKIYNKISFSKNIEDAVFSIYMFSQMILLFKNGVSVFAVRITLFFIMFKTVSYICKHIRS